MSQQQTAPDSYVLLIGDNGLLVELVAANLAPLPMQVILLGTWDAETKTAPVTVAPEPDCQLIVLALSKTVNEPVVILARLRIAHLIGAIPLLIISDRPFTTDGERRIFHLPFPFGAAALQQTIATLLRRPAGHHADV